MKRARVAYAARSTTPTAARRTALRLADGRVLAEDAVVWLPPFEVGTIIALGLNYADHAKELALQARQDEPLVFLKGPSTLIGHRGQHAPAGRRDLHALRVRAGGGHRPHGAERDARRRACDYVAGYTVANDYAIRDYLEN